MISLVRAELLRARSRRLLQWSLIGLLGTLLVVVIAAWTANRPPSPAERELIRQMQGRVDGFVTACKAGFPDGVQGFLPERFGDFLPPPDAAESSFQIRPSDCEGFARNLYSIDVKEGLRMRNFETFLFGYVPPLFALMLMFGASFIGGDWSSRSITQALTYEPRRTRLLGAKGIAIGITSSVVLVGFLSLVLAALSFVASFRGTFEGFDLGEAIFVILRLGGIGAFVALFGSVLAAVTRSTGGTFGIAFAYLVVIEPFIVGWKPWIGRWLFTPNGIAITLAEPLVESDNGLDVAFSQSHLWQSALVLLGLMGIASVIVSTVFRRREIA